MPPSSTLCVRALGRGYGHRPVPWAPAAHFTDETPEGPGGLQRHKRQDLQESASLPHTTSPVTLPSSALLDLGGAQLRLFGMLKTEARRFLPLLVAGRSLRGFKGRGGGFDPSSPVLGRSMSPVGGGGPGGGCGADGAPLVKSASKTGGKCEKLHRRVLGTPGASQMEQDAPQGQGDTLIHALWVGARERPWIAQGMRRACCASK